MTVEKNTQHVTDALDRLIEQYKESSNVRKMLQSLVPQVQDLEDVVHDLFTSRTLTASEGAQLDKLGELVGQDREGFDDDFYRILITARIGINVSNGEYEKVLDVFKLLTQSALVHLQEWYPAGYGVTADNEVDNDLMKFIANLMKLVDPAGVRLEGIMCFNGDEAFAFAGGPGNAKGFGDDTDPLEGGEFGFLHDLSVPFAFDGDDTEALGFGDTQDPIAGGAFE